MNYFQEFTSKNPNQLRNKISILDVLNMSSGIEWDESSMAYTDASSNCVQMEKSSDWAEAIFRNLVSTLSKKTKRESELFIPEG